MRPVVARVRALPDNSLIDRLVRGRAWIPVLGVMLAGIVFMQVEILKLGSSMGRWLERSASLTARNESLRAEVAGLADDRRIESMAAGMGMVMPPAAALGFLSLHSGAATAALGHIRVPSPSAFLASLPAPSQTPTFGSASPQASTSANPSAAPSGASPSATSTTTTTVTSTATATPAASGGQPSAGAAQSAAASPPVPASPGGAAIAPPSPTGQSSGR